MSEGLPLGLFGQLQICAPGQCIHAKHQANSTTEESTPPDLLTRLQLALLGFQGLAVAWACFWHNH